MSNLLHRLFRYGATEKRAPLEDYLSEILADFVARAPPTQAQEFVLRCFVPSILHDAFRSMMRGRRIDISTQVRLPDGHRLDLLMEIAGLPVIVIENKTWAAFQKHARPARQVQQENRRGAGNPADDEQFAAELNRRAQHKVEYESQLTTYANWLAAAKKPEAWPGVLVLLTHATQAPSNFTAGSVLKDGIVPHVIRWRSVHDQLRRTVGSSINNSEVPAWMFVGQELCSFLEVNAMNSSDMNSVEIASVNVAMAPLRKLQLLFSEIGAEILQQHSSELLKKGQNFEFIPEHSRFWGWTYFQGQGQFYVGYGVYFAPVVGELATSTPPLPEQEHAFVAFGSDDGSLKPGTTGLPLGWVQVAEGWHVLKTYPLSDRRGGERFPQYLVRMVQDAFPTIVKIRQDHLNQLELSNGGRELTSLPLPSI